AQPDPEPRPTPAVPPPPPSRAERRRATARAVRVARCEEVRARRAGGDPISAIARALGMGRMTVRRWRAQPDPPPPKGRPPRPPPAPPPQNGRPRPPPAAAPRARRPSLRDSGQAR